MSSKRRFRTALSIAVLVFVFSLILIPAGSAENPARAIYINVAQGDSILLDDGQGTVILVDGGPWYSGDEVLEALADRQITTVSAIVATHADADHIGGLIDVLEDDTIIVQAVYYNGFAGTTQTWDNFAQAVLDEGLFLQVLEAPASMQWGEFAIRVLNPTDGLINPDQNEASVVLHVQAGSWSTLLTSDMDLTIEAQLLLDGVDLAADVLKVGHHGSDSSSSADFLTATSSAHAVIQVGNNPYGHPDPDVLARLEAAAMQIWRTDLDGTITLEERGVEYVVFSEYAAHTLYLSYVANAIAP